MSSSKTFGYVFWEYDRFPGVIWSRITGGPYRDGSVGVAAYGTNARIEKACIVKILTEKKGEEVIDALNLLIEGLRQDRERLGDQYRHQAKKVAPFLGKLGKRKLGDYE